MINCEPQKQPYIYIKHSPRPNFSRDSSQRGYKSRDPLNVKYHTKDFACILFTSFGMMQSGELLHSGRTLAADTLLLIYRDIYVNCQ